MPVSKLGQCRQVVIPKEIWEDLIIFFPHQNERAVDVAAILARDEKTYR